MTEQSLFKLIDYIESRNYRGYDPYDALKSPLFHLPLLRSNKLLRFGAQQFVKRFPLNLRPLLAVPGGYNPVTLGLCIQGYSFQIPDSNPQEAEQITKEEYLVKIRFLIEELKKLIPQGFHGACWGYDFPWEARHVTIAAYQPTVVATGIISNALFECYRLTGLESARDLCISAGAFVLYDLNRTTEGDTFCFSYSPFDRQQVYNASMKGARLLAQVYSLTGDEQAGIAARLAVRYVLNHQNSDGSWFYSNAAGGGRIDNYHTGYVLDCLDEYRICSGDQSVSGAIEKGYIFYKDSFIEPDGRPKFYHSRWWPVDSTAAAQAILTLCRFGDLQLAEKVAAWMIGHMQSPAGYFYYRKNRFTTQRTSFMRWSNAWMMAALSRLVSDLAI